ncbi:MAG: diguanylate phosphodiesterase, partial [Gallionella sp.]
MSSRNMFRILRQYIAAAAVIATALILVFAIYFTELGIQWITFLTGILIASILAVATRASHSEWRASHSEWLVMRRTAQLAVFKKKFEDEKRLRKNAEE